MIEEFRLSLFAQDLRTLGPVSAKRLEAQLARARGGIGGRLSRRPPGRRMSPATCLSRNGLIRSIGSGNTIVVAFSLDRSDSVCR